MAETYYPAVAQELVDKAIEKKNMMFIEGVKAEIDNMKNGKRESYVHLRRKFKDWGIIKETSIPFANGATFNDVIAVFENFKRAV